MRHCEATLCEALQKQLDELNTAPVVRRKVARLYRYQGKFVEQFVYWKMRRDPMFEVLDSVVPRHGSILDLGCGYGVVTHWLASFTDSRSFLGGSILMRQKFVWPDEPSSRCQRWTSPRSI